jgi:hypothetical protein
MEEWDGNVKPLEYVISSSSPLHDQLLPRDGEGQEHLLVSF